MNGYVGRVHSLVDAGYVDKTIIEEPSGKEYDGYFVNTRGLKAIRGFKSKKHDENIRFWIPVGISLLALFRPEITRLISVLKKLLGQLLK